MKKRTRMTIGCDLGGKYGELALMDVVKIESRRPPKAQLKKFDVLTHFEGPTSNLKIGLCVRDQESVFSFFVEVANLNRYLRVVPIDGPTDVHWTKARDKQIPLHLRPGQQDLKTLVRRGKLMHSCRSSNPSTEESARGF